MKKGFTLLEVLSAVAVLAVMVLVLARMFIVTANVSQKGMATMERNSAAEIGMETMLNAIEGMVVNELLACYSFGPEQDDSGFGHDQLGFLTTAKISTDDYIPQKTYEFVQFYVEATNKMTATGVEYLCYDLKYRFRSWGSAISAGFSPELGMDWWEDSYLRYGGQQEVLIPNIVRFDCYLTDYNGENAMTGGGNFRGNRGMLFDSRDLSTYHKTREKISDVPPAAFDIYIQVASAEAAVEGGMLLLSNDSELRERGKEILVRDSVVYFARAVPVCGPARFLEAHDRKPHHYYED